MKTWIAGTCLLLLFSLFFGACASHPKRVSDDVTYECVAERGSDVYHRPSCIYVQKTDEKNLIHFNTPEEAEEAGLRPCKECIPSGKKSSEVEECSK